MSSASGHQLSFDIGSIKVTVKKGTITDEKVDAIVNSTSPDLNLESGRASKALYDAAGKSIRDECKYKYPKGIKYGEVAKTGAGKLGCKFLFHGCLKSSDSSGSTEAEKVLRDFVLACLWSADKHLLSSIAFPALGTGFIGISSDQSAATILQCVADFEKTNCATTLNDVRCVIYHKDDETFNAFLAVAQGFDSTGPGVYEVLKCGSFGHNVRSRPSLKATPIGMLRLGDRITAVEDSTNPDGTWIKLDQESVDQYCQTKNSEYWSLVSGREGISYLQHESDISEDGAMNESDPFAFSNLTGTKGFNFGQTTYSPQTPGSVFGTPSVPSATVSLSTESLECSSLADSDNKKVEIKIGSVQIEIIQGSITDEQADVYVIDTNQQLDLSDGEVSNIVANIAGPELQLECNTSYQDGIAIGDEIAIVKGYNLLCKAVYFCAVPELEDPSKRDTEVAGGMIHQIAQMCLMAAGDSGYHSIVFPALGTGYQNIPAKVSSRALFSVLQDYSKNSNVSICDVRVCIPAKTDGSQPVWETFLNVGKDLAKSDTAGYSSHSIAQSQDEILGKIKQKEKKERQASPKVRRPSTRTGDDKKEIKVGSVRIHLIQGSLLDQQVDVFVANANPALDLSEGNFSKLVSRAAGPELQQECNAVYPDGISIGQLAVTNGHKLPCKAVYFCTLPELKDPSKEDISSAGDTIYQIAQMCLLEADDAGYHSIAFPALGTGYQNIPAETSSYMIMKALEVYSLNSSNVSVRDVRIVIYTRASGWEQVWEVFCSDMRKFASGVERLQKDQIAKRKARKAESKGIDFSGASDFLELFQDFTSDMVRVAEDFHVRKKKPQASGSKKVTESSTPKVSPQSTTMATKRSKEWFLEKYSEELRTPKYWTKFSGGHSLKQLKVNPTNKGNKSGYYLVDVDSKTFDAVKKMVYSSWERDKVGQGRDAGGLNRLSFSKVKVIRVQQVENLDLFEKYSLERQRLFGKAYKQGCRFESLDTLSGSNGAVRTAAYMDEVLMEDIYPEINEYYLFHGTKPDRVDAVLSQGLDNRMAGDKATFGLGVYAAESSTKSDQYVDSRSQRSVGDKKQMFMIRMCMGEVCVTDKSKKFRRSPCVKCLCDDCSTHQQFSDSLVVDGLWMFREFIVYDPRQCYPEYLITYVRE